MLCAASLLAGCVIAADNEYFKLRDFSAKTFNESRNTWCFTFTSVESLGVCSPPYRARSRRIGLGVPIIPQFNRESPLAYDKSTGRRVQLHNDGSAGELIVSNLRDIPACTDSSVRDCSLVGSLRLAPGEAVWLKLPLGKSHEFDVENGGETFTVRLIESSQTRWHPVTV